jgi:hypothetical protein
MHLTYHEKRVRQIDLRPISVWLCFFHRIVDHSSKMVNRFHRLKRSLLVYTSQTNTMMKSTTPFLKSIYSSNVENVFSHFAKLVPFLHIHFFFCLARRKHNTVIVCELPIFIHIAACSKMASYNFTASRAADSTVHDERSTYGRI